MTGCAASSAQRVAVAVSNLRACKEKSTVPLYLAFPAKAGTHGDEARTLQARLGVAIARELRSGGRIGPGFPPGKRWKIRRLRFKPDFPHAFSCRFRSSRAPRSPEMPSGSDPVLSPASSMAARSPASIDRLALAGRPVSSSKGTIARAAPAANAAATSGSARKASADRGGGSSSPSVIASSAHSRIAAMTLCKASSVVLPADVHPGRSRTVTP
jgi:hypothetical protein